MKKKETPPTRALAKEWLFVSLSLSLSHTLAPRYNAGRGRTAAAAGQKKGKTHTTHPTLSRRFGVGRLFRRRRLVQQRQQRPEVDARVVGQRHLARARGGVAGNEGRGGRVSKEGTKINRIDSNPPSPPFFFLTRPSTPLCPGAAAPPPSAPGTACPCRPPCRSTAPPTARPFSRRAPPTARRRR